MKGKFHEAAEGSRLPSVMLPRRKERKAAERERRYLRREMDRGRKEGRFRCLSDRGGRSRREETRCLKAEKRKGILAF